MEDHIRDLLSRFQYSEQLRETAVFRILFGGEEVSQVMDDLGIHSGHTLRSWVQLYRRKMKTGLLTLPAMKQAQRRDMAALKQRNEELEQTLQQANWLILALNTMIETAEKELNVPIRKKSGRIGGPNQTVLNLRENEIAKVSVGSLCRLFGVSRQAFHARKQRAQRSVSHAMLVLDLVTALRRYVPGLGTRKLHLLLAEPLAKSGIKLGRDKLHKILYNHAMVIRQGRQMPQTTDSNHRLQRYPNLLLTGQ
ncbi:MAG: hypothetical protein JWP57_3596 [Spirosoma sp.]|nr:hypothetical protein [Spirosoma sp.]